MYTVAPASPSCTAMPCPIPLVAPVTRQTLPLSDIASSVKNSKVRRQFCINIFFYCHKGHVCKNLAKKTSFVKFLRNITELA